MRGCLCGGVGEGGAGHFSITMFSVKEYMTTGIHMCLEPSQEKT